MTDARSSSASVARQVPSRTPARQQRQFLDDSEEAMIPGVTPARGQSKRGSRARHSGHALISFVAGHASSSADEHEVTALFSRQMSVDYPPASDSGSGSQRGRKRGASTTLRPDGAKKFTTVAGPRPTPKPRFTFPAGDGAWSNAPRAPSQVYASKRVAQTSRERQEEKKKRESRRRSQGSQGSQPPA